MEVLKFLPISAVSEESLHTIPVSSRLALVAVKEWITEFIAQPHPQKGARGPVCPRVPHALRTDCIHMAYVPVAATVMEGEIKAAVIDMHYAYAQLFPTEGPDVEYRVGVIVFDRQDIAFCRQIEHVQRDLKLKYLEMGLMFGKFHPHLESRGMYNSEFRPHRCPFPCFAVRFLVETDAVNLMQSSASADMKRGYLTQYLMKFGERNADSRHVQSVREYLDRLE